MLGKVPYPLCRDWLPCILNEYAVRLDIQEQKLALHSCEDVERILAVAPWHFRLLIGCVELAASAWCVLYRLWNFGCVEAAKELAAFAKIPVISTQLLRLYRSLLALSWFEHPEVLRVLGSEETLPERQERYRHLRQEQV